MHPESTDNYVFKDKKIYFRPKENNFIEFLYKLKILKPKYKEIKGITDINEIDYIKMED